jgi:hypothetical protein
MEPVLLFYFSILYTHSGQEITMRVSPFTEILSGSTVHPQIIT